MKKIMSIILILCSTALIAQRNWKTETSKDGKVIVKSDIVNTDDGKVIYYIAETTTDISLEKAEKCLRDSQTHKNFLENTTESKQVEKSSESKWITYYFFDAPWPMPNSDAVQEFTVTKTPNSLTVSGTSKPKAYKSTDVKRMNNYDITYHFEKLENQKTKLTITAKFSPVGRVPKFLLKGWFPKGPAGIATRLINEISKK
ncbi:hypothetical protein [Tenacibaculum sp. 190524A05c]|uniref:hypothetical protein n=1 Tax=Tenacibaculum platacis TaxID=3137852 RepID=UPI0031FB74CB